ncbi:MAG: hypothetical protein WD875_09010, partial [Pirellulales bacterium]
FAFAAEPWADARLPVVDGLQVWLDATRENAARSAAKMPLLGEDNDRVDTWHDASGNGRHVVQETAESRPRFHGDKDAAAMRFDGIDDYLANAEWGADLGGLTVIIAAAPRANAGDWRGFLSMNKHAANDYQSGLNLDLGPGATRQWETLNAEGPGFGGAVDLFDGAIDFGPLHVLSFATKSGQGETRAYLDGKPAGRRDRSPGKLRADRLTIGGRYFNNFAAAETHGQIEADFAEVLIYDRVLTDEERAKV